MNVIFDMDGLMFDTEKVFIKAWDYAGERIGIGKAGYMVYKTLGMSIVASYEIWNEEFGDRYNQEELRKYTKEFLKNYYEILTCIGLAEKDESSLMLMQYMYLEAEVSLIGTFVLAMVVKEIIVGMTCIL